MDYTGIAVLSRLYRPGLWIKDMNTSDLEFWLINGEYQLKVWLNTNNELLVRSNQNTDSEFNFGYDALTDESKQYFWRKADNKIIVKEPGNYLFKIGLSYGNYRITVYKE